MLTPLMTNYLQMLLSLLMVYNVLSDKKIAYGTKQPYMNLKSEVQ